jgi:hypothetical protein
VNAGQILELVAALALIALGVWQYRKRVADDSRRGSQSGVLLLLVGAIVAMHALGLFSYRPSQAEINAGRPAPLGASS